MDNALTLENVYHKIMLAKCKDDETSQWENARHDIMVESITESCNYYGSRRVEHDFENEREF